MKLGGHPDRSIWHSLVAAAWLILVWTVAYLLMAMVTQGR